MVSTHLAALLLGSKRSSRGGSEELGWRYVRERAAAVAAPLRSQLTTAIGSSGISFRVMLLLLPRGRDQSRARLAPFPCPQRCTSTTGRAKWSRRARARPYILAATLFSTFSLVIAFIVKTRERFMGVGQVLATPLFFASNAVYPTAIMPGWLRTISHLNPLTYVVDALRRFMLAGSPSSFGLSHDYEVH